MRHLFKALAHSWGGFLVLLGEAAFRQELVMLLAALSAGLLFGMDSPIEGHNPGGTNRVAFERLDGTRFRAVLGGDTAVVAKGELGPDA